MRRNGIRIDKAYSSPAFRCVTTCASVLDGLQQSKEVPVNVDPNLFEWCVWHKSAGVAAFDWLSAEQLRGEGLNINGDYRPRMSSQDLEACLDESVEEYTERNGQILDEIVAGAEGQNVLIVGHAATVDLVHQRLCDRPVRAAMELNRLMHKISYCSLLGLERDGEKGPQWTVMSEGKYSVTHTANQRFDPTVVMN